MTWAGVGGHIVEICVSAKEPFIYQFSETTFSIFIPETVNVIVAHLVNYNSNDQFGRGCFNFIVVATFMMATGINQKQRNSKEGNSYFFHGRKSKWNITHKHEGDSKRNLYVVKRKNPYVFG